MTSVDTWARILDDARDHAYTVTAHLVSGATFTGLVTAVDVDLVSIDQRDPESSRVAEHTIALAAIIAITSQTEG